MIGLHSCLVSFKEVFTTKKIDIYINPYFTVTQFIETIRPVLSRNFGINENELDIVESGQFRLGLLAEEAPALEPSSSLLRSRWGEQLKNVSFYVRRKNFQYPQVESVRIDATSTSNVVIYNDDCPICLETTRISRRYMCSHGICSACYQHCISRSISICSLCRSC